VGNLEDDMKVTILTAGLLTSALSLAPVGETSADVRVGIGVQIGPGHPYYRDYRGAFRYGFDRGADEGYREGERDARRHERFEYRDEGRYRDSDRGYKGWMGPRYQYERGYRRGFAEGYAQAYRRFARYDRDRYDRDRYDRRGW
jgi:hypothetical protein